MNKFNEKKHFVGVDISKDTLDLSLISELSYGSFSDKKIENSFDGFDNILEWLKSENVTIEDCLFCMEHTGVYGLLFFAWLAQMDIDFCVEPGMQTKYSQGMTRGKNDKIDARRLADYAYTHRAKLTPFELPSTLIIQLKQLLTYRDQIVRIRSSLKNSLKSHKNYQRVSGLKSVSNDITGQIQQYDQRIKEIEDRIRKIIKSDDQMRRNFNMATSVVGIGLIIGACMLVSTNNFTSFQNGRKYACYAGIAPFEYNSGTSLNSRAKTSYLGNKQIKKLLSNGANTAYKWDPELRAYYNRKKAEGKDHKLVINSISCKLVNRVFAAVKRQKPYVKLYQHNFA